MAQGTEVDRLFVALGMDASDFEKSLEDAQDRLKQMGRRMKRVGQTLTATVTAPLTALGAAALTARGKMERFENGLAAVMGSASAATAEMERLREAALAPGLAFDQAVEGSLALQSVGLSADEAREALSSMGNALAVSGARASELGGVSRALQQIISKGTVSAEEINQIAERIPQIRTAMQDAFGTADTEALQEMNVEATRFVNEIVDELGKLPQAEAGITNAFENLKQTGTQALAALGEAINQNLGVTDIINSLSDRLRGLTERFRDLSPTAQRLIVVAGGIATAIGPALIALGALTAAIGAISAPVAAFIAAIGALGAAAFTFRDEILSAFRTVVGVAQDLWARFGDQIVSVVRFAFNTVNDTIRTVLGAIGDVVNVFVSLLTGQWGEAFQSLADLITAPLGFVKRQVVRFVRFVIEQMAGLVEALPSIGETAAGAMRDFAGSLKTEMERTSTSFGNATAAVRDYTSALFAASSAPAPATPETAASSGGGAGGGGSGGGSGGSGAGFGTSIDALVDEQMSSGVGQLSMLQQLQAQISRMRQTTAKGLQVAQQAGLRFTQTMAQGVGQAIGQVLTFQAEVTSLGDVFKSVGGAIVRSLQRIIQKLISAVAQAAILKGIMAAFGIGSIGGVGGSFESVLGGVLGLAKGGIVTSPTLAMIGEGGQSEAVIPLDRLPQMQQSAPQERLVADISLDRLLLELQRNQDFQNA